MLAVIVVGYRLYRTTNPACFLALSLSCHLSHGCISSCSCTERRYAGRKCCHPGAATGHGHYDAGRLCGHSGRAENGHPRCHWGCRCSDTHHCSKTTNPETQLFSPLSPSQYQLYIFVHVLAGGSGECEKVSKLSVHIDQAG